jgi:hypothetical protein
MVASQVLGQMVPSRESVAPFAAACGSWAVDVLLFMRRFIMSAHIRLAGVKSDGSAVRV